MIELENQQTQMVQLEQLNHSKLSAESDEDQDHRPRYFSSLAILSSAGRVKRRRLE